MSTLVCTEMAVLGGDANDGANYCPRCNQHLRNCTCDDDENAHQQMTVERIEGRHGTIAALCVDGDRRVICATVEAAERLRAFHYQQPHDLRPGERFDAECLYIHDNGEVYCGRHVGTEATYTPHEWSCLGLGPTFNDPLNRTVLSCETCHPKRRR